MAGTQHTDALLSGSSVLSVTVSACKRAAVRKQGFHHACQHQTPGQTTPPQGSLISHDIDITLETVMALPGITLLTPCLEVEEAGSHQYQEGTEGCRGHTSRSWCSGRGFHN